MSKSKNKKQAKTKYKPQRPQRGYETVSSAQVQSLSIFNRPPFFLQFLTLFKLVNDPLCVSMVPADTSSFDKTAIYDVL